jgi:hypothetical protein
MANLNSNTTGAILATAQMVPEIWSKEVEKPFYKALKFAKLVNRDDSMVSAGGDMIRKPFLDTINARAKSASTAVTYDSPDGTPISYNIDKHYYSAVLIEDFAKVQSTYAVAQAWREAQAEAVARQVDTDLAGLYGSAGTTVAAGAAVDDADVIAVVAALDNANVPQSERYGVIGQYTKGDLLNVNKYTTYDQTGKTGKAVDGGDGLVASVYGMDIMMSQNVQVSTTGRNMFFHKKAISLAQQLKPTYKMEDSVDQIGMKAVLHTIYGVGVERASALVQVTRTTAA